MNQAQIESAFSTIVERLDSDARYVSHRQLTGGVSADIHAVCFEVSGVTKEVVVRRNGDADWKARGDDVALIEFELHAALFNAGLPVPAPLLNDATGEILPSPYWVMTLIEGDMLIDLEWLPTALEQMADFLLYLHSLDVPSLDLPERLPRDEDPIAGALAYIPEQQEYATLRAAIAGWQVATNKPTLLHGDFWPNNVLWKDQKIAAVIDWEDGAIGTPVTDLAGARCEILGMFGEDAMNTFTQHYINGTSADLSDLPLWEAYSSFAALSEMGKWGLPPEEEARRRSRTTLFAQRAAKEVIAAK